MSKLTLSEVMSVAPNCMAYDAVFNYARQIVPKDGDETKTLIGTVGGDSPIDGVVQPILIRSLLDEELAQWIELHRTSDDFKEMTDEEFEAYHPSYVVVDGFGRVEAHVAEFGDDADMEVKILNLDDVSPEDWINQSLILGGVLNTSQRGMHYLDEVTLYQTLLKSGRTQTQIGKMFGKSKPYVSAVVKMKVFDDKQRAKLIKEETPRYKALEWANKLTAKGGDGDGKDEKTKGENDGDGPNGSPLSVKDRAFYIRACQVGAEGGKPSEKAVFNSMALAFAFSNGEFGAKTLEEAAIESGLLPDSFDRDFENETRARMENEAIEAAEEKRKEREAKKAEAEAAKEAKKAAKEAEREAKKAEAEAAKAAKKAEEAEQAKSKAALLAKKAGKPAAKAKTGSPGKPAAKAAPKAKAKAKAKK